MAIKERLLKQLNIVWDGLNAMPPFHSRDLNTMRNALVQARDLCFQGRLSGRSTEYQDSASLGMREVFMYNYNEGILLKM